MDLNEFRRKSLEKRQAAAAERHEKIIEMWPTHTVKEIAAKLDVGYSTVSGDITRLLKQGRIKRKKRGRPKKREVSHE